MLSADNLNYGAIAVGAIINMVIGSFWYSPAGFGKAWAKISGKKMEDISKSNANKAYMVTTIAAVVQVVALSVLIHSLAITSVGQAIVLGVLIWLAFIAASTISDTMFSERSWKLWQINHGYYFLVLVLNSVLLAVWY